MAAREAAERELPPIAIELVDLLGLDNSDERVWELVIVALKNAYVRGVDRGIVDAVLQAAEQGNTGWLVTPETASETTGRAGG